MPVAGTLERFRGISFLLIDPSLVVAAPAPFSLRE